METLKIVAFISLIALAFVWGILGAINEYSSDNRKSYLTYIGGSCIAAIMFMLIWFILKVI